MQLQNIATNILNRENGKDRGIVGYASSSNLQFDYFTFKSIQIQNNKLENENKELKSKIAKLEKEKQKLTVKSIVQAEKLKSYSEKVKFLEQNQEKLNENMKIIRKDYEQYQIEAETAIEYLQQNLQRATKECDFWINKAEEGTKSTSNLEELMNKIQPLELKKICYLNSKISELGKLKSEEAENCCKICFENNLDTVIVPCGHTICSTCVYQVQQESCPFCKTQIQDVLKLHLV